MLHTTEMRARRGCAVLALALAITATGCLRTDVGVYVNDDRSGAIDMELYFADRVSDDGGVSPDDLEQLVDLGTRNLDGAEVTPISADNASGFRIHVPFDDYQQLAQALTNPDLIGNSVRAFSTFQISEDADGKWSLSATIDTAGLAAGLAVLPAAFPGQDLDPALAELNFSVTLPGDVARSNADRTDGGTATWKLNTARTPPTLTMKNEPSGLTMAQLVLIAGGAMLLIGFVLVVVTAAGSRPGRRRRRRRRKGSAAPEASWQPPAPGSQPTVQGGRDLQDLPVLATAGIDADGGTPPPPLPPLAAFPLGGARGGGTGLPIGPHTPGFSTGGSGESAPAGVVVPPSLQSPPAVGNESGTPVFEDPGELHVPFSTYGLPAPHVHSGIDRIVVTPHEGPPDGPWSDPDGSPTPASPPPSASDPVPSVPPPLPPELAHPPAPPSGPSSDPPDPAPPA